MIYVVSDIHGEYDQFITLLEKLNMNEEDKMYVLGDVLDRGPHPIESLVLMMLIPNIIPIAGNHELMALVCLDYLNREVTDESIEELDEKAIARIFDWKKNGGGSTISEFSKLDEEMRQGILDYLRTFSCYEELNVGGIDYVLVHAGLGNFSPDRKLEDYALEELLWERPDYSKAYFKDKIVVTGHTPTKFIPCNPNPGYVYKGNNHIAIDCGASMEGGRLAALCLDTGEVIYSRD